MNQADAELARIARDVLNDIRSDVVSEKLAHGVLALIKQKELDADFVDAYAEAIALSKEHMTVHPDESLADVVKRLVADRDAERERALMRKHGHAEFMAACSRADAAEFELADLRKEAASLKEESTRLHKALKAADDRYHDLAMALGVSVYVLPESHEDIVALAAERTADAKELEERASRTTAVVTTAYHELVVAKMQKQIDEQANTIRGLREDLMDAVSTKYHDEIVAEAKKQIAEQANTIRALGVSLKDVTNERRAFTKAVNDNAGSTNRSWSWALARMANELTGLREQLARALDREGRVWGRFNVDPTEEHVIKAIDALHAQVPSDLELSALADLVSTPEGQGNPSMAILNRAVLRPYAVRALKARRKEDS